MLSTARSIASMSLRGKHSAYNHTRLLLYRIGSTAVISSSLSKSAMATQRLGLVVDEPPTPVPMRKRRRELPLASQEVAKGVTQYALYVNMPCLP
jgi:NADH dehydrogenase (ubiquinone) Fe-S protein 7